MITPHLKPGDKVAVIAPASKVDLLDVQKGISILTNWGYQVQVGSTVGASHYNFADTFENRLQELQYFLDQEDIRCIIAARGGYGVSDLIDHINWTKFLESPKWIIGFSDLTALLLQINKLNIEAIHGPMVKSFSFDEKSNLALFQYLSGLENIYNWNSKTENKSGNAAGQAIGGNLALLTHSIGSKSDISYDNKILFIEDVSEKLYAIDRFLVQLKRAGKLKNLAALVVGDFSDIPQTSIPFGEDIYQIVRRHTSEYNYPVAFDFRFGHEDVNLPIIMGRNYEITVQKDSVTLKSCNHDIL